MNETVATVQRTGGMEPLLVRASAGTGKTYRLTGRLLSVLVSGADVETVLATTFTRKAAGEILQRILVTLANAASDPVALEGLRQQTGQANFSADDSRKLLHRLMRDIHRVKICTLDSFFSQLASSFPFELRLPPGWRLSDEIEEIWIRERAIERMLAAIDADELESLVAMLGKGDAIRSIDAELHGIIDDGYSHSRWCGLKAWETLRVDQGPDDAAITAAAAVLASADIGHKSANTICQKLADDLAARRIENLFSPTVVQSVASAKKSDTILCYRKPLNAELVDAIRVVIATFKANALGLLKHQTLATGQVLIKYGHYLETLKQQTRVISFDDVAFRLANWIEGIDPLTLSARMDATIQHLLLDEFQDTAPVQWSVLRPFARRAATQPPKTSFFCVGDVKQAIYGWRGGRAAIFDAVADEVPDVLETTQNLSYRSSPVISAVVTRIFSNLTAHPKFSDAPQGAKTKDEFERQAVRKFSQEFPLHESARTELPGYFRLSTYPASATDQRSHGSQSDSQPDQDDEATGADGLQYAANEIYRLAQLSPRHSVGVLTRTNRSVGELIFHLKRLGADVSQEGGNPLVDSAPVEMILSALMMTEHPGDARWVYHVSHSPLANALGLSSCRRPDQFAEEAVQQATERVRRKLQRDGLTATLVWLATQLAPVCESSDQQRLRQLIDLSHVYNLNPQPRLARFVDYVRFKRVERPRPAQVRVMTIHQAKGLEFDTVVLPEMDGLLSRGLPRIVTRSDAPVDPPAAMLRYLPADQWPLLPPGWRTAFGQAAAASITESLCLMYVALTRPRHALHCIIRPPRKATFESATPAALIHHALGCTADPTIGNTDLFTEGEPQWFCGAPFD
jgi:ATP-dependent exoDNAse (exonuclease V) beta subunit